MTPARTQSAGFHRRRPASAELGLIASLATIALSCGRPGPGTDAASPPGGPEVLSVIDSTRVAETDSLYLGRPASMSVDQATGKLYVADPFAGRVMVIAPSGDILAAFGKKGPGPAEIGSLYSVFLVGTQIVVADAAASAFKVVDASSGEAVPIAAFQGSPSRSIANTPDTAWVGIRNPLRSTAVGVLTPGVDSVLPMVPLPREYQDFPNLTRFTLLPVLKRADTLLVGFSPLVGIIVASADGAILDTVFVPRARRRLNSERVVRAAGGEWAPLMNGVSALNAMSWLPNNYVGLIYYDNDVPEQGAGMRSPAVFLTILSPGLDSACVDARILFDGDVQPLVGFRADTVIVLYQKVLGDSSMTWVKRLRVDPGRCAWSAVPGDGRMLAQ